MVATLDLLEASGLAERRPHATDRRKHVIHLTDQGAATLAKARRSAGAVVDVVFGALSEEEFAEFHRLTRKIVGFEDD